MAEKFSFPPPTPFDGVGGDPEAGCGCGENCARGPGDPCPLDELDTLVDLHLHLTVEDIRAAGVTTESVDDTVHAVLRELWKVHGFEGAWYILCGIAAVQLDAPD